MLRPPPPPPPAALYHIPWYPAVPSALQVEAWATGTHNCAELPKFAVDWLAGIPLPAFTPLPLSLP